LAIPALLLGLFLLRYFAILILLITVLFELYDFEDFDESKDDLYDKSDDDSEHVFKLPELSESESVDSPLSLDDDEDPDVDKESSYGSSSDLLSTDSSVDSSLSLVSIVEVSSSLD
jgi:hypothetical protein